MEETILKKMSALPPDKQEEVKDFVNYLMDQYLTKSKKEESFSKMRSRNLGRSKGKIQITEDFNDTPEDFKGYY